MQIVFFLALAGFLAWFAPATPALWRSDGAEPSPTRRLLRTIAVVLWIVILIAFALLMLDYILHGNCLDCPDIN